MAVQDRSLCTHACRRRPRHAAVADAVGDGDDADGPVPDDDDAGGGWGVDDDEAGVEDDDEAGVG